MSSADDAKAQDLVSDPVASGLPVFALPTLASTILQSLSGSINTIWVGQLIGETALAATSNASLVMFLLSAGVFGFGMAATILVGQSIGKADLDGARRAMGQLRRSSSWSRRHSRYSDGLRRRGFSGFSRLRATHLLLR